MGIGGPGRGKRGYVVSYRARNEESASGFSYLDQQGPSPLTSSDLDDSRSRFFSNVDMSNLMDQCQFDRQLTCDVSPVCLEARSTLSTPYVVLRTESTR